MFRGVDVSNFVGAGHAPDRYHLLFQYCPEIPAHQYCFLGFDILSDTVKVKDKGERGTVTTQPSNNCVAAPSSHKDGSRYQITGNIEDQPKVPEIVIKRVNKLIESYNRITKDVLPKCRTWFKNLWDVLFKKKEHELYHKTDIFFGGMDGRNRCLNFLAELKANGANKLDLGLICAVIFGDRFDVNKTESELSHINNKPAKLETIKADPYFSKVYEEDNTGSFDIIGLNLDKKTMRNYSYRVIALEYMKENIVKYVAGSLRKYENGVYPTSEERIEIMKSEILKLAWDRFKTPLSESDVKNVIGVLEMLNMVKLEDCEPNADKVILANNKIINLETFDVSDFSQDQVYFSKLPVDYDPNAPEPVMFNRYLKTTFKGNDTARMQVQELAGYLLARHYKYQHVFYLLGDGGEGKGVYIKLLGFLLGKENACSYSLHQLTDHPNVMYHIADMHGKMGNICGDVGVKRVENTEHIKKLSSGTDFVTGRHPYGRPFDFINVAKIVFLMNKLAKKDVTTTGDKRRDFIISFTNKLIDTKGEIKDMATVIKNAGEMSGVLNWAIEGLKRLENQGGFTGQKSIKERGIEYDQKGQPMKYFIDECLMEADCNTENAILYKAYNIYRKAHGMPELSDEEMKNGIKYYGNQLGWNISETRLSITREVITDDDKIEIVKLRPRAMKNVCLTPEFKKLYRIELYGNGINTSDVEYHKIPCN